MRTASFFTSTGPGRISIARWAPRGTPTDFAVYRPLNPAASMLKRERAEYEPLYPAILARLDPHQVVADLHRLADPHEPVLLCWKRPPFTARVWCHRRLVAAWLECELGLVVKAVGKGSAENALRAGRTSAARQTQVGCSRYDCRGGEAHHRPATSARRGLDRPSTVSYHYRRKGFSCAWKLELEV